MNNMGDEERKFEDLVDKLESVSTPIRDRSSRDYVKWRSASERHKRGNPRPISDVEGGSERDAVPAPGGLNPNLLSVISFRPEHAWAEC